MTIRVNFLPKISGYKFYNFHITFLLGATLFLFASLRIYDHGRVIQMNMEIALILAHCCLLLPDFSDQESEDIPMVSKDWFIKNRSLCDTRYSGYSFVLNCYSLSLAFQLCLYRDNIKTDFNQINDNLNETSIQNTLMWYAR